MRDIKFRGKRIDNKEWVCGDIVFHYENQRKFILCGQMAYTYIECGIGRIVSEHYFEVIPETIGQYTGLKDKNGTEIYEGDIIKCTDGADKINELNSDTGIGNVEWLTKWGFWNISNIENVLGYILHNGYVEVIGNIWENPELLK